jgi:aminoacrylate hydrolase
MNTTPSNDVDTSTTLVLLLPQSTAPGGRQSTLDALSAQHRLVQYDPRSVDYDTATPSMELQASKLAEMLTAKNSGPVSLLCLSTGCGVGISLAANHPECVHKMVLLSPWSHGDEHLTSIQNLRIAAARVLDPGQYSELNSAILFSPKYRRDNRSGFQQLAKNAHENPQDADLIANRLSAILSFDARPLLPSIVCKTLVLTSKDDQLMPYWFGSEIAQNIKNAELIERNEGGHMLLDTCPDIVVSMVLGFLK